MDAFLNIYIKAIWIVILFSKHTESLELRYGFEYQPYGYCHDFPFNTFDRHIILKNANGFNIWNIINSDYFEEINGTLNLNASFVNNSLLLCFWNLSRRDIGNYCLEEVKSERQFNFSVDVYYGPTELLFAPELQPVSVLDEHSSLTINCIAECNPDCNISWWKNTEELSLPVSNELNLTDVSRTDSGNYTCIARNPESDINVISKSHQIYVTYMPKIDLTPNGKLQLKEHSDVNVSCNVDSYPPSNISWSKDNEDLSTTISKQNDVVLYLLNNTCNDTGIYECFAYNGVGMQVSRSIRLDVLCKPRFVGENTGDTIVKKMKASVGDEILMNVKIQSNPTPDVKFISPDVDVSFSNLSDTIISLFMWTFISSESDFRWYSVIIGNSLGSVAISLEVERDSNFVIGYQIIIGITLSLLVLLVIFIVIYQLVKRRNRSRRQETRARSYSVRCVNTEIGVEAAGFDDENLYQNRIREIELRATESYEDLSITGDNTSYEEMNPTTDLNEENRQVQDGEPESDEIEINCNITRSSDGYLVISGLKRTEDLPDGEKSRQSEESCKENNSIEDEEGYIKMNDLQAEVKNVTDIKHEEQRESCEREEKNKLPSCECDNDADDTINNLQAEVKNVTDIKHEEQRESCEREEKNKLPSCECDNDADDTINSL